MIRAVVFDLDGVLRRFDPAHVAGIENRRGLAEGSIQNAAFSPELLDSVITGRTSRAVWVRAVGEQLGDPQAAQECGSHPSTPNAGTLALRDELRATGIRTAILTNGTGLQARGRGGPRHPHASLHGSRRPPRGAARGGRPPQQLS